MQSATSLRSRASRLPLSRRETSLVAALVLLTAAVFLAPALELPMAGAAAFADTRSLGALPNALDVLSNLPFALMGLLGLRALGRLESTHEASWPRAAESLPLNTLDCAWLFFAGLLVTTAGSVFFHLHPDVLRLAADRAGMTIAFAGMIGLAVSDQVSPRAAWPSAWFVLASGLLSVAIYHETGNVMPWAVVQFGGMALLVALALSGPRRNGPPVLGVRLGTVVALYALAKLFELADAQLFEVSGGWLGGHAVKHVLAALAALPVLLAVRRLAHQGAAPQTARLH